MSNAPKNVTPAEIKAMADEKKKPNSVPTQYQAASDSKIAAALEDVQNDAVDALQDALRTVESKMKHVYGVGVDVRIIRSDDGEFTVEIVDPDETKVQKLVAGAKGLFKRNKKLVIASAGLLATSVLLKVLANRQAELEADEVIESSDDVATDA